MVRLTVAGVVALGRGGGTDKHVISSAAALRSQATITRQPILGSELAGEVVTAGQAVSRFAPGDKVFAARMGAGGRDSYVGVIFAKEAPSREIMNEVAAQARVRFADEP